LPSADGETPSFRRFSFCQAFSFAPISPKEKAAKGFSQISSQNVFDPKRAISQEIALFY